MQQQSSKLANKQRNTQLPPNIIMSKAIGYNTQFQTQGIKQLLMWTSGKSGASHALGPGSIPGEAAFFFLFLKTKFWGINEFRIYGVQFCELPPSVLWAVSRHTLPLKQYIIHDIELLFFPKRQVVKSPNVSRWGEMGWGFWSSRTPEFRAIGSSAKLSTWLGLELNIIIS